MSTILKVTEKIMELVKCSGCGKKLYFPCKTVKDAANCDKPTNND